MSFFQGLFLGVIQGLAEFLPVSSSGHLSLFQHLFGLDPNNNLFITVMMHLGTLAAVFIVYYKVIWKLVKEFVFSVRDICTGQFSFKGMNHYRRMMVMILISTLLLVFMVLPVFGGYSLKDGAEAINNSKSIIPLGIAFMTTGAFLVITFKIFNTYKKTRNGAKVKDALIIGGAQCVATISGISRSGSTVCAGLLCGLSREYMVEYSFIMSIPVILASALSEGKDALEVGVDIQLAPLFAGIFAALISGIAAIKLIQWLIRKDRYKLFGYYCLVIGVITLVLGVFGVGYVA